MPRSPLISLQFVQSSWRLSSLSLPPLHRAGRARRSATRPAAQPPTSSASTVPAQRQCRKPSAVLGARSRIRCFIAFAACVMIRWLERNLSLGVVGTGESIVGW